MEPRKAVIIGAGPAGLTAAYELLTRTDIIPIILEATIDIGGISKTVNYKGNRIDIGGHRFFSKSVRVTDWWLRIMPLQGQPSRDDRLLKRPVTLSTAANAPDPESTDRVMLVRSRLSRIYFLRSFFDYPISLKWSTFKNLGLIRVLKIGLSYLWARLLPIRPEMSLEDFLINRFGRILYSLFFRDYTRKVWGVACRMIKPEWGAQRIKGLSITATLLHAARKLIHRDSSVTQSGTETSLIEQFMYPKLGPGQMWEEVARQIEAKGGRIHLGRQVVGLQAGIDRITSVTAWNSTDKCEETHSADFVFSTMPVKDLMDALTPSPPHELLKISGGLQYRDFVTVGLLLRKLRIKNQTKLATLHDLIPDNWIYVQESEVRLGRIQVFNNWSPYMVKDPGQVWLGLEYFCNEQDDFWRLPDDEIARLAIRELALIEIIDVDQVIDFTVIRMPKTYPAYFGTYEQFHLVRDYVSHFQNLFLVGRNGMHKYNNADHSMLTAMTAVDNIVAGRVDKANIWTVNTEESYHERK